MFSDPDRFRCFHTARRAFLRRPSGFHLNDVTAVQVCLIFEEGDELSPRCILFVPSVVRLFQHPLHIQVLDEYGVVFADEPRRQLALFTAEEGVFVFEVEPAHDLAVTSVDVVQNAEINTDAVARVERIYVRFLG